MRAVRYHAYGEPEVVRIEEVEPPEPGPGQVRVRVRTVGVNPADWKMRRGLFTPGLSAPPEPRGTGLEFAGDVDAVGPGVELAPGTAVFGAAGSAAATYVVADTTKVVPKPEWLSYERAAALPVAAETAYRTLALLGVERDHTLLIHAVAGGVGLTAAQLALARGATVIGTASERHHEFLREIGVQPVAYGDGWEGRVREVATAGVDRVLDASGRGVLPGSIALTGDPSHVVTIADKPGADEHGARFTSQAVAPLSEVFEEVLPLVRDGRLDVPIERTYPLEQVADAHRHSEAGHLRGKLLLTVD